MFILRLPVYLSKYRLMCTAVLGKSLLVNTFMYISWRRFSNVSFLGSHIYQ